MKTLQEKRLYKKLLKWGKKNKFRVFCILPVVAAGMFFSRVMDRFGRFFSRVPAYFKGNGKRFSMLVMSILLFVVYSSFSFPIFITGDGADEGWMPISDEARDIVLAEEPPIDLDDLELLEDEDVLLEDETDYDTVHGMEIEARYSASEILELNQPSTSYEKSSGEVPADYRFDREDWKLLLVNKQHSIPQGYEEQVPLGKIMTMKGIMHCDERIIDELLNMFQEAKDDGVTLLICSPYRDLEYQQRLFNRKITYYMKKGLSYMEAYQVSSRTVTVPNASEHQLGLALDIVTDTYTSLNEGFENTDAGRWLAENSYRFGFILRYPRDKEDITGIRYEPWHFRYVGVEAATVITEKGLTLEELWEMEEFWEEP